MANQSMQPIRSIKKLDPDVVNRIAAGEVVLRPANALKELIENSLDAGATSIKVEVKDGGMKYLQIVDNGCGIRKDDLEIVCERHTTSKLESLTDLQSLNTYGFRGEALASISLISNVLIVTKTPEEKCGYRVSYNEGIPKDKPVPCAANQGTAITVENLFYNVPLRQKALTNIFEEHKRVQDIVGRYAVHNASVGFSLKKFGQNHLYVNTMNTSSTKDVIGLIFDTNIARNLLEKEGSDDTLQFKYKILATNLIYSVKKIIFILFINHRLVKAEGLQKEIAELYSIYLPPQTYPFMYISLEMPAANVDVNVHPRKETVFYLHEEYINKKILTAIQQLILGKDAYQTYKQETLSFCQTKLAQPITSDLTTLEGGCPIAEGKASAANNVPDLSKDLALSKKMALMEVNPRVPEKSIPVESMQNSFSQSLGSERKQHNIKKKEKSISTSQTNSLKKSVKKTVEQISTTANDGSILSAFQNPVNCEIADVLLSQDNDFEMAEIIGDKNKSITNDQSLSTNVNSCGTEESSVSSVIDAVKKTFIDSCDKCLKNLLDVSTFVTCSNYDEILITNEDHLYECVFKDFCKEYFYQVIVKNLGNLKILMFDEPKPLWELLQNSHSDWACSPDTAQQQLMKNAGVLKDVYGIAIDKNGNLLSLPYLIEGYVPSDYHLPEFIKQLACNVPWDDHKTAFLDVCQLIASYYCKFPTDEGTYFSKFPAGEGYCDSLSDWNYLVEFIIFPAVQKNLWPSKELYLKSICEVHV